MEEIINMELHGYREAAVILKLITARVDDIIDTDETEAHIEYLTLQQIYTRMLPQINDLVMKGRMKV